ncbi:hypothetical protein BsWGS_02486 [Bradybaena similaris]
MKDMKQLVCLLFLVMLLLDPEPGHTQETTDQMCYDKVGCFSNDPPFATSSRRAVLPESPDKLKTKYILYTRENRDTPVYLDARYPEDVTNVWPDFRERPTKFIIHGFFHTVKTWSWMEDLAKELLKQGDYNSIVVDWSGGNQLPYIQATANTRVVGAQIAVLINYLIGTGNFTADDFHIIGHSLGAHIAGYTGARVAVLGRITGLDPAGPYFRDVDRRVRLDDTDAKFVDAMHTDAVKLGWGMETPSGHVDFYPNGGRDQPGCGRHLVSEITDSGLVQGLLNTVFCSHQRAVKYFNESINSPCPFLSYPCDSWDDFQNNLCQTCGDVGCSHMGFQADKYQPPAGQTVKYYLRTAPDNPFCLYHVTVIVKFSAGTWPSVTGEASVVLSGNLSKSSWISLTGDRVLKFSPGQTSTFYVDLPQDVGNVTAVSFKWNKSFSLFSLWKSTSISVEEIDIIAHETGARFQFCSEGQSVKSGSYIMLIKPC